MKFKASLEVSKVLPNRPTGMGVHRVEEVFLCEITQAFGIQDAQEEVRVARNATPSF